MLVPPHFVPPSYGVKDPQSIFEISISRFLTEHDPFRPAYARRFRGNERSVGQLPERKPSLCLLSPRIDAWVASLFRANRLAQADRKVDAPSAGCAASAAPARYTQL